jgi:RNase H-fold protein (predicted Holliday junction resolvase)
MTAPGERVVLAVDPGHVKCGMAVVRADGEVLRKLIVKTADAVPTADNLAAEHRPVAIVVGSGTGSKRLLPALRAAKLDAPIEVVDESHSSEQARARWVDTHPARGLSRLLPRSLRYPTEPIDDLVAVILAERYWKRISAGR